jgi:glycosyltransferase involved in cell wall biosynthesis
MKPALSCIIAVYNRPDFLEKIFVSLLRQTHRDFEVVIADDGSGPEIATLVKQYSQRFERPVVHIRHEDQGFRKSVIANRAVSACSADYLVFIDGDCVPHHRFLERHYCHRKRCTILSGRRVAFDEQLSGRLTLDDVCTGRMERPRFWLGHCATRDIKNGFYIPFSFEIENFFLAKYTILGCNFSLFKDDFRSINGYDERIVGRGMEDSNLYERFRKKGCRVRTIVREAIEYHLFHRFDPVPHDEKAIRYFCFPEDPWTDFGMVRKNAPSR